MRLFFFLVLLTAQKITPGLAQSPFVPFDRDYYQLIERYEIKQGFFTPKFHTGTKPYSRDEVVAFLEAYKKSSGALSDTDDFNLDFLIQDSWEYASDSLPLSRNTVGKRFYQRPADFFYYRDQSLDVHINPVLYFQGGAETQDDNLRFRNSRGVSVRGSIDRKIGFYTMLATTDLVFPSWIKRYVTHHGAVPGQGFWKRYGEQGYSFFSARGHLNFKATEHVQVVFGHDTHFIGDGFRSFVLSDFSNPFAFLKINTQIGSINFTNLWGQMTADIITDRGFPTDGRYPQKWFSFHRLGINLGERFNLGVYESVMASQMDWNYLNPVIFYRWVEHQLGTPDKVMLGTDFKWHPVKGMQLYGQFVLDEFVFNEFFGISGKGSSRNKHGFQLGYKYVSVAGINNLDLQVEYNHARPYTYQEKFAYQSYTNYRIPLTHPLGANFREVMASSTFQAFPKLRLKGIFLFQMQGKDPEPAANFGGDILKDRLETSTAFLGNFIGQGIRQETLMFTLQAEYMLRHNLYVDFSHTLRKNRGGVGVIPDVGFGQIALRLNMGRFDPHF